MFHLAQCSGGACERMTSHMYATYMKSGTKTQIQCISHVMYLHVDKVFRCVYLYVQKNGNKGDHN